MTYALETSATAGRHFEHSVDLICSVGSDGTLRRVNDAFSRALGWRPDEITGASLSELIHPDDLPVAEAALSRLEAGEPVTDVRIRMRERGAGWRWFEWSAAHDGREQLSHAIGRDVDARVARERVLQRERRHLEEAQAYAQVGSWEWEIETGVRSWSPQHYRNHGFEPSEFAPDPRRLLERIHEDDRERVGEFLAAFHANPRPTSISYRVVRADGGVRVVENRCYGVEVGDGTRRVVGATRDVTAEREADRRKDEFIGLVSHELRTPLTAIIGYAEMLRDFEADALSEQGRRFLSVIERNSRRELGLVSALLTLGKIEAGTFRIEPRPTEIGALARAAVADAEQRAADGGIRLAAEVEPVPPTAADPERIAQLVDNLISNAIKFTERGGRVTVRVLALDGAIAIEVADTGIGITPGEQGWIFDTLFRAEYAEELHIDGSGLGLTIVKAIVDAHEAMISLASEPGKGSTFRVELPVRESDEHRAEAAARAWQPVA